MSAVPLEVERPVLEQAEFFAGPLAVELITDDAELLQVAGAALELFSVTWPRQSRPVRIYLDRRTVQSVARGDFLRCARMRVDASESLTLASTASGITSIGLGVAGLDTWHLSAPPRALDEPAVGDVEDLLGLALTFGWRRLGYVPVHAAAVERDGRCLLLCAPSGGGKSTLTAALMRNGWKTLGDDKLLLRCENGVPRLAALLATFNLHPQTNRWFSEIGDLERLAHYSAWTQKRRVSAERIAGQGAICMQARPTHVVRLSRTAQRGAISVRPLAQSDVLPTLLGQVVVPSRPAVARGILSTLAAAAPTLQAIEIAVGEDAYRERTWLRAIEEAL